ncbi:MAG: VOC family protein [Candidatus Algichlamydia australiensis]|nr:VOC family protein [Chlamydiales bacterium]
MVVKKSELAWINVSNMQKTKKLFVELLGMKVVDEQPEWGWMELEGIEGGSRIGVANPKQEGLNDQDPSGAPTKPGQNAIISLSVNNLDEVRNNLEKKGVNFVGETMEVPGQVKMATFLDDDKNVFQLVENIT